MNRTSCEFMNIQELQESLTARLQTVTVEGDLKGAVRGDAHKVRASIIIWVTNFYFKGRVI